MKIEIKAGLLVLIRLFEVFFFAIVNIMEQEKPKEEPKEEPKGSLEEFSELLIKLGREVEEKLEERRKLEEHIGLKEGEIRELEKDVFSARARLARLATEFGKLEAKRKEFEEKKFLLKKE